MQFFKITTIVIHNNLVQLSTSFEFYKQMTSLAEKKLFSLLSSKMCSSQTRRPEWLLSLPRQQ